MVIKPNLNFKMLKEVLAFDTAARETLLLIFEQFKGKLLGKIDRKKMTEAEKQKLKRGIKSLKEAGYLIDSTVTGCYMLNPKKFFVGKKESYTDDGKEGAFWYDVWAYIHLKGKRIRTDVQFSNEYLNDIEYLWDVIPDFVNYNDPLSSWKLRYVNRTFSENYFRIRRLKKASEHQAFNCVDVLYEERARVEKDYQRAIVGNSALKLPPALHNVRFLQISPFLI